MPIKQIFEMGNYGDKPRDNFRNLRNNSKLPPEGGYVRISDRRINSESFKGYRPVWFWDKGNVWQKGL